MRPVLVLRPEPGASATVEQARKRGLDAVSVPLFEIEPIAWQVPEPSAFDALLLTSANTVRQAGEGLQALRSLPVFAVGEATADAAREAGFTVTGVGKAGIDSLLESTPADLGLLHLCGEDRKAPGRARQRITPVVVYRARATLAPDLSLAPGSVALIHSPRAALRLAELIPDRGTVAIAAISPAAAEVAGTGWERIEVAGEPNDDALLALAARLCNKPDAQ